MRIVSFLSFFEDTYVYSNRQQVHCLLIDQVYSVDLFGERFNLHLFTTASLSQQIPDIRFIEIIRFPAAPKDISQGNGILRLL